MKAIESVEKLFIVKRKSFHFDEPMRVIHMLSHCDLPVCWTPWLIM